MRCLSINALTLMVLLIFVSLTSVSFVLGHVGEKCPVYFLRRRCMASNSYCDDNSICRCKPDYPIKVDAHTCRKPARNGGRCSVNKECTYLDSNSFCTQGSFSSSCECHDGFYYDKQSDRCTTTVGRGKSSGPDVILPLGVGLALAVICLVCCCLGSAHIIRRIRGLGWHRGNRRQNSLVSDRGRNGDEVTRWVQGQPSAPTTPEDAVPLPPYEIAISLQPSKDSDELPPSYEDVIKERR